MTPSTRNNASIVAGLPHKMQNPAVFLLVDIAGLVPNGFTTGVYCWTGLIAS
jgi:hypothetical protein